MNGVILLDKETNITSFDCLGPVKRLVNRKSGHAGTLDKFASGLMIVLCGSFTRLVPLFMGMDKTYEAVVRFGEETDTLDPEGEVIATAELPTLETIEKALTFFHGEILQIPPRYSALHVNGKRSYQMARNGEDFELEARPVSINSTEILGFNGTDLNIRLNVSKGTYVRSFARDLALACNSRAHLVALRRTMIGPYSVEEALRGNLSTFFSTLETRSSQILSRLPNSVCIEVTGAEENRLFNGVIPSSLAERLSGGKWALLFSCGKLISVVDAEKKSFVCQVRP